MRNSRMPRMLAQRMSESLGQAVIVENRTGAGGATADELFSMMAHVKLLHVPYKGAPEAATAVAAGHIDIAFPSVTGTLPLVAAGKLKALAVSSTKRASLMPSVPTLDESGLPGFERLGWNGVLAPAAVSKEIVARLNATIVKAVNTTDLKDAFVKQGYEVQTGTPEEFAAFIRREFAQNAKLVKFAGVKIE